MSDLPGILADLQRLVGFPAALAVAEAFGGRRLTGLWRILNGEEHPLIDAVGHEAAHIIARELAGELVEIPKCDDYWRSIRNTKIRTERAMGAGRSELARRYRLTERQITNILGDDGPAARQESIDFF